MPKEPYKDILREERYTLRLTIEEKKELFKKAKENDMKPSEYVRSRI